LGAMGEGAFCKTELSRALGRGGCVVVVLQYPALAQSGGVVGAKEWWGRNSCFLTARTPLWFLGGGRDTLRDCSARAFLHPSPPLLGWWASLLQNHIFSRLGWGVRVYVWWVARKGVPCVKRR